MKIYYNFIFLVGDRRTQKGFKTLSEGIMLLSTPMIWNNQKKK